jgi:uncharacterized protein (DUF983 family)
MMNSKTEELLPRPLDLSIRRGIKGDCPHCGKGKIFGKYLKVLPECEVCHEDFSPQRADDLPAYIVLFIVGHIVIGGMMTVETYWEWPVIWHIILWPSLTLVLSLVLLPRVKGAIISLQWAMRMHGFVPPPKSNTPKFQEIQEVTP